MAVVNTLSTQLTNRDAAPPSLNNPNAGIGANLKNTFGKVASVSGDSAASTYRCVQVPTNARVSSVRLYSAALGGSAATDIGLYRSTEDGGAVVDADFFGSAVSVVSAVNGTEVSHESGVYTIAKRQQPLWQAAGASTDPGGVYDVVLTLTAASAASDDIGVYVDYVV